MLPKFAPLLTGLYFVPMKATVITVVFRSRIQII